MQFCLEVPYITWMSNRGIFEIFSTEEVKGMRKCVIGDTLIHKTLDLDARNFAQAYDI